MRRLLAENLDRVPLYGPVQIERSLERPWNAEVVAEAVTPSGEAMRIPAFWLGEDRWAVRYAASEPGEHTVWGHKIDVTPEPSRIAGLRRGPLALEADEGRFRWHDGTPELLLADSWWHGMTSRLDWPCGFEALCRDRRDKGFSAIQFAAGLACDMEPLDPRDANEGGLPWTPEFERIRPEYYTAIDRRIESLLRFGLLPIVTGMWGYAIAFVGVEGAKAHWRNLVARYGCLPVIWNLCGESRLAWYLGEKLTSAQQVDAWTKVARYVREIDPWRRPLTVHPGPDPKGVDTPYLGDLDLIDFQTLQPGHSGNDAIARFLARLEAWTERHGKPAWVGECAWEGMHLGNGEKVQRQLAWISLLSGCPGYAYGADAIWQMNERDRPFGASPLGHRWGDVPWREAMHWGGSKHCGIARKALMKLPWTNLRPANERLSAAISADSAHSPVAAAAPGEAVVVYFPSMLAPWSKPVTLDVGDLSNPVATWIDPTSGDRIDAGPAQRPTWTIPHPPVLHDWALEIRAS